MAASAGSLLQSVRVEAARSGATDQGIGDLGDAASQEHIAGRLAEGRPDDAVLSEEAQDDPARLRADRVWIVDPLDGTREFAEGRLDWAVHVALWENGGLAAGAVAIPDEDLVLTSADGRSLPDRAPGPLRIAVSRTRPPEIVDAVSRRLSARLVPMGSAGVKIAAVVRGQVDAYIHAGGQYEWDSAAPVAVAVAAGAHASQIDGAPLGYNRPDPYLPDLVVCRREFAADILDAIASASVPWAHAAGSDASCQRRGGRAGGEARPRELR